MLTMLECLMRFCRLLMLIWWMRWVERCLRWFLDLLLKFLVLGEGVLERKWSRNLGMDPFIDN